MEFFLLGSNPNEKNLVFLTLGEDNEPNFDFSFTNPSYYSQPTIYTFKCDPKMSKLIL